MLDQPKPRKSLEHQKTDELERPTGNGDAELKRRILQFGGGIYRSQDLTCAEMFDDADVSNLQFLSCTLNGTSFFKCKMNNAKFTGSMIAFASLLQVTGTNTVFDKVHATGTSFCACVLIDATFDYASLCDADFSGSNLQGASFRGAVLHGAAFVGANLLNACFDDATLTSCVFRGARMPNGRLYSEHRSLKSQLVGPRGKAA
ncbi:MAG: pentapeptide repeat-containing protein [Candidatus Limnocylindrus sp.]